MSQPPIQSLPKKIVIPIQWSIIIFFVFKFNANPHFWTNPRLPSVAAEPQAMGPLPVMQTVLYKSTEVYGILSILNYTG